VQEGRVFDLADRTARVREAADRCARIVRDFLAAARPGPSRKEPLALERLVQLTLDPLGSRFRSDGIVVSCDVAAGLPEVLGDPEQLRRMLDNLLANAQQSLRATAAPRIAVAARRIGAEVEIAVTDNGPGVPQDMRDRIFDPFFTTKPAGAGLGLGLAVSRGIVEAHGGSLLFLAPPEGGARFVVRLPVATTTVTAARAHSSFAD
jgi:signal transduction histidine kinase